MKPFERGAAAQIRYLENSEHTYSPSHQGGEASDNKPLSQQRMLAKLYRFFFKEIHNQTQSYHSPFNSHRFCTF
jgi:hypothetical protein